MISYRLPNISEMSTIECAMYLTALVLVWKFVNWIPAGDTNTRFSGMHKMLKIGVMVLFQQFFMAYFMSGLGEAIGHKARTRDANTGPNTMNANTHTASFAKFKGGK